MKKDQGILSFQLPLSEIALLDAEAGQLPTLTTRSEYCRQIVLGRHQVVIQDNPQLADLIEQLEQTIDGLEAEKAELEAENQQQVEGLTHQHEQTNKAHQQAYAELSATHTTTFKELVILKLTSAYQEEDLTKKLKQTTERLQVVEADNAKLTQELTKRKKAAAFRDECTQLVGNLLGHSPDLQEKIKTEGLSGLLSGKGKSTSPSEDEKLGQGIRHDFPGPRFNLIVNVLRFLRDTPAALSELVKGKAYGAYLAKKQPANTPTS